MRGVWARALLPHVRAADPRGPSEARGPEKRSDLNRAEIHSFEMACGTRPAPYGHMPYPYANSFSYVFTVVQAATGSQVSSLPLDRSIAISAIDPRSAEFFSLVAMMSAYEVRLERCISRTGAD